MHVGSRGVCRHAVAEATPLAPPPARSAVPVFLCCLQDTSVNSSSVFRNKKSLPPDLNECEFSLFQCDGQNVSSC